MASLDPHRRLRSSGPDGRVPVRATGPSVDILQGAPPGRASSAALGLTAADRARDGGTQTRRVSMAWPACGWGGRTRTGFDRIGGRHEAIRARVPVRPYVHPPVPANPFRMAVGAPSVGWRTGFRTLDPAARAEPWPFRLLLPTSSAAAIGVGAAVGLVGGPPGAAAGMAGIVVGGLGLVSTYLLRRPAGSARDRERLPRTRRAAALRTGSRTPWRSGPSAPSGLSSARIGARAPGDRSLDPGLGSSPGDLLWRSWTSSDVGEMPVELVGPLPETAYTPTPPGGFQPFPERDLDLLVPTIRPVVAETGVGPTWDEIWSRLIEPVAPIDAMTVEALTAMPPHLRVSDDGMESPALSSFSAPGSPSDPASGASCASCDRVLTRRADPRSCEECDRLVCSPCAIEATLDHGATWCSSCASPTDPVSPASRAPVEPRPLGERRPVAPRPIGPAEGSVRRRSGRPRHRRCSRGTSPKRGSPGTRGRPPAGPPIRPDPAATSFADPAVRPA